MILCPIAQTQQHANFRKEFLSWLEKKIGCEAYRKIPAAKTRHGSTLMTTFETAKLHFEGHGGEFELTLPRECGVVDDEENGVEDGVLTVTE